jgi:hypothetical protein
MDVLVPIIDGLEIVTGTPDITVPCSTSTVLTLIVPFSAASATDTIKKRHNAKSEILFKLAFI